MTLHDIVQKKKNNIFEIYEHLLQFIAYKNNDSNEDKIKIN